jgi:methyl-accepting chemotaxis protein
MLPTGLQMKRTGFQCIFAIGEVAKSGAAMAKQTVYGMEKIRQAIGFTSEKITKLGEQSGEIDKM